jgi:hypothetical protein
MVWHVNINYGEKKKGAYTEDSADKSCPEANLPDHITQQSQYDPLGLLSVS